MMMYRLQTCEGEPAAVVPIEISDTAMLPCYDVSLLLWCDLSGLELAR
jgi:hypothetical protein